MTVSVLTTNHYGHEQYDGIRGTLVDVYAEVYAKEIAADPFFSADRFAERLTGHASNPGWWCVAGSVHDDTVGYAYGAPVRRGGWWNGLRTPVDPGLIEEDGVRTFGLYEIMVRAPWRGTGIARAIHDDLMSERPEERASLLVEREHPRVRARYEEWGYRWFGEMLPAPDAPLYDVMVLDLR